MELMTPTTPSANRWAVAASSLLKRFIWAVTGCRPPEDWWLRYSDRRAKPRLKVHFQAQISGESGLRGVRGVNINSDGALILTTQPLAPESVVVFHVKSFGLMGFAKVRYCTERGLFSYAIELSFPSPLMRHEIGTWQFHRVHQTDNGWSVESEASMNLSPALRAA
jgi:hypothetical protein